METLKAEVAEFGSLKDLKPLLAAPGPCISIYLPLSSGTAPGNQSARANSIEWREAVRSLSDRIQQFGAQGRELLESVSDWDVLTRGVAPKGRSLAVFRAPSTLRALWMDEPVRRRAVIGPHFYIRPLLPELTRAKSFYLLALSQKNVRVLRCDARNAEEITLPPEVAANFDAYMNTAKPDHLTENRSSPGPSTGASKGVVFGTGTDRQVKDQYLAHFFRQIDRGINELLRGKAEPLVLAGVEYELSLYRTVNSFPNMLDESVQGAPNSLKSGEMHARAIEATLRAYANKVDEVLTEYNHKVGGGSTNKLKDVVAAAHDGRVLKLLVSDSLDSRGAFDASTHTTKARETGGPQDEDLVNDAAVQSILHAGQIYVVPNGKMPNGAPLAAVFRF
jgi:hypothetical protein